MHSENSPFNQNRVNCKNNNKKIIKYVIWNEIVLKFDRSILVLIALHSLHCDCVLGEHSDSICKEVPLFHIPSGIDKL